MGEVFANEVLGLKLRSSDECGTLVHRLTQRLLEAVSESDSKKVFAVCTIVIELVVHRTAVMKP